MSKSNIEKVIEEILSNEKNLIEFFSCEDQNELYNYCLSKGTGYTREEFDDFIEETISKANCIGEAILNKEMINSLLDGGAKTSFGKKIRQAFTKVLAAGLAVFSVAPIVQSLIPSAAKAAHTDIEKTASIDIKNKSTFTGDERNDKNKGKHKSRPRVSSPLKPVISWLKKDLVRTSALGTAVLFGGKLLYDALKSGASPEIFPEGQQSTSASIPQISQGMSKEELKKNLALIMEILKDYVEKKSDEDARALTQKIENTISDNNLNYEIAFGLRREVINFFGIINKQQLSIWDNIGFHDLAKKDNPEEIDDKKFKIVIQFLENNILVCKSVVKGIKKYHGSEVKYCFEQFTKNLLYFKEIADNLLVLLEKYELNKTITEKFDDNFYSFVKNIQNFFEHLIQKNKVAGLEANFEKIKEISEKLGVNWSEQTTCKAAKEAVVTVKKALEELFEKTNKLRSTEEIKKFFNI